METRDGNSNIIHKTNYDALEREAEHTNTEQPWQTWVHEFVFAQLVKWGNSIGEIIGDEVGSNCQPIRRELASLRREFDAIRDEVAILRGLRDLRSEVEEARAQVPKVSEIMRGPPGPSGPRGEEGPPGKLPIVKLWAPETVYYAGDVVAYDGGTFQAQRDTGQPPSHADWICLATGGRDGKTIDVRGTFDESVSYRRLDVVALNGGSFIALKDAPGPCPGSSWQLLASQGKRGAAGEKGERGVPGPRGDAGASGVTIRDWKIDRERYVATPIMSDGSDGPPLELRGLFEQFFSEVQR